MIGRHPLLSFEWREVDTAPSRRNTRSSLNFTNITIVRVVAERTADTVRIEE